MSLPSARSTFPAALDGVCRCCAGMGGTKKRPRPTAKCPTTLQAFCMPSRSTSTGFAPNVAPGLAPSIAPSLAPNTDQPTKSRREVRPVDRLHVHATVGVIALVIIPLVWVLLTSASLAWTRSPSTACKLDAADATVLQLAFCAMVTSMFPRHHHHVGGFPKEGPVRSLEATVGGARAQQLRDFDDVFRPARTQQLRDFDDVFLPHGKSALRPEAILAYRSASQPRNHLQDLLDSGTSKASAKALGESVQQQLEGDEHHSLRLNAARAYKQTLSAFKGGAADLARIDVLQSDLFEFVKEHRNFEHAVCTASSSAAYYPFSTEREWSAAKRMVKRSHSRPETAEMLSALSRAEAESLNRVGRTDALSVPITVDGLHRSLERVPT